MMVDFSKQLKRLDHIQVKLVELANFFNKELAEVQPVFKPIVSDDKLHATLRLSLKREINLDQFGFLFGEVVHQLRAVLDNMVLSIGHAILESGAPEIKNLSFPICDTEEIWLKGEGKFKRFPANIIGILKHAQPFNGFGDFTSGTGNLLATIRDFDNHDKHYFQLEPKYEQQTGEINFSLKFADEAAAIRAQPPKIEILKSPFIDGGEFVKIISTEPLHGIQGSYGIGAAVTITRNSSNYESISLLNNAYAIVTVILDLLISTIDPNSQNLRILRKASENNKNGV